MRGHLVTTIFIFFFMTSQAQRNAFDSVVNRLMFHILTDHPDTCVLPFLQRCVPVLASKPQSGGSWTMYPPGPVPKPQDGFLSIKVDQHPSLHSKHSGARFDILTNEWKDGPPGVKEWRVWFYFERKVDADSALKLLVNMFKQANAKTKNILNDESQMVVLSESGQEAWQEAKLTLRKENAVKPKYSILFTYGSDDGKPW